MSLEKKREIKKSVFLCKIFSVSLLNEVRRYSVKCKKLILGQKTALARFVATELSMSGVHIGYYKRTEIQQALSHIG